MLWVLTGSEMTSVPLLYLDLSRSAVTDHCGPYVLSCR